MSPWIIYIYVLISLVIAFTAFSAGWRAGLSAIGTSFFAFVGGAGLRGSLYGTTRQKVAGLGLAVGLMSITHWVGQGFSVHVFGYDFTGMGMVRVCDMLLVHNQAIRSFREVMKRGELVRSPGIDRQILSDCASSPCS